MQVPNSSVLLGGVLAVIGFFVIPVLGLPDRFRPGLYLAEYARLKDAKAAWNSSWESIKAIGLGAGIEFVLALLASITFGIGRAHPLLRLMMSARGLAGCRTASPKRVHHLQSAP